MKKFLFCKVCDTFMTHLFRGTQETAGIIEGNASLYVCRICGNSRHWWPNMEKVYATAGTDADYSNSYRSRRVAHR